MQRLIKETKHVKKYIIWPIVWLLGWMAAGCSDGGYGEPSFLHIEDIRIECPSQGAITTDSGFYTSEVRGVYIVMKRQGATEEENIGLFELPITAPILYSGDVEYIELSPAVWQSGQSGALIFYSFYRRIHLDNLTLAAGDTLDLGVQTTTYNLTLEDALLYEPFEPTEGSLVFDSVMQWVTDDPDGARSGRGYGVLHVPDSVSHISSLIDRDFYVFDATKAVYLEFDARSDKEFSLWMRTSVRGENEHDYQVMNVYPRDHWVHIYANLGRTLAYTNHPPSFRLFFQALNFDGTEGDMRIDNVRLLTTSHTL